MVGGTIVALYLGHRRSIDFDLFTQADLNSEEIKNITREDNQIKTTLVEKPNEPTLNVDCVKTTFLKYPFEISFSNNFEGVIKTPDLLILAAMKARDLGRRAKWKDYVDLYYIFDNYPLTNVVSKTKTIFKGEFSEKLFREQLFYFEDIDYTETIDFLPDYKVDNKTIKTKLRNIGLEK